MSTIFIFHGIGGDSEENWFPWMKTELEKKGHRVIVPNFPHPDEPTLEEWREYMKKYHESIDEHSVFVGHSLGGLFALRLLEHMTKGIRATFLVACVTGPEDGQEYAARMITFTEAPLNDSVIRKNSIAISMFHSNNDVYIPLENAKRLAKDLGCAITMINNGGHLGTGAGYSEFPKLRDAILLSLS